MTGHSHAIVVPSALGPLHTVPGGGHFISRTSAPPLHSMPYSDESGEHWTPSGLPSHTEPRVEVLPGGQAFE